VTACGLEGAFDVPPVMHPLNMEVEPTTEEILELMCADGRISWDELKRHEHGHLFEELQVSVGPRQPDCEDRLEVGADDMMRELDAAYTADGAPRAPDYPFLLIGRRAKHVVNGTGQDIEKLARLGPHNPTYLHPVDMSDLNLRDGDIVEVRSAHGAIEGVAQADDSLRRGVVSMTHAFGRNPGDAGDPRRYGANTNQLLSLTAEFDPLTGMPRMGAVPVALTVLEGVGSGPEIGAPKADHLAEA
jgi:anaerobic selenocysteine-containing dehydrogenase